MAIAAGMPTSVELIAVNSQPFAAVALLVPHPLGGRLSIEFLVNKPVAESDSNVVELKLATL